MSFNADRAFEVENGIAIHEGAGVFSGSLSPVGYQAPVGSLYLRTDNTLWEKYGADASEWRLRQAYAPDGGSGVTPPFFFSRGGNCPTGTYLKTGDVVTSDAGQIFPGANSLAKMSVTADSSPNSVTRIQLQRRTGEATFADIDGAYIDVPSGQYKISQTGYSVDFNSDEEVAVYIKSGSSLKSVVVGVFVVPTQVS